MNRKRNTRDGRRAVVVGATTTIVVAGLLGGCSVQIPGTGETFRILAGSEVRDLEPLLAEASDVIDATIEVEYTGTLSGAEQIASGGADGSFQAAWFSSDRYLSLLPESSAKVGASENIMASPVILGVRESKAAELGWDSTPPSWGDIAAAAEAGDFTFAMTNPAASNTGFSALIGVATALSGTGSALTTADIDTVAPELTGFFSGQTLTAGSSGWLKDAFVERQAESGQEVDGLVNYESVLIEINENNETPEPLTLVYPSDGVVTADYPLTFLSSADDDARTKFDTLVSWLQEPAQQQRILDDTRRRPLVAGVSVDDAFTDQVLVDLPFPNQLQVANDLINAYLNEIRQPPQTIFVLDTSGSMEGDRIEALRQALRDLSGADTSTQGTFARFRNRESVTLIPFSTEPGSPEIFEVPESGSDDVLAQISGRADGLEAFGDTAIYDSLIEAYQVAQAQVAENPDTFTSIVLMTDGENTFGQEYSDFESFYGGLPAPIQSVPTFAVLFGDSDVPEMQQVAELTGGETFDARDGSLSGAFQEIRGYQ